MASDRITTTSRFIFLMTEYGTSGVHTVDLDDLVTSMKKKLNLHCLEKETTDNKKRQTLISRVPSIIRDVDGKAYDPIVWSVGPYHNGISELIVMEKEKWKCLSYMLHLNRKISLQDYLEVIGEMESTARDCYAEELTMDSSEFIKMLLLDGCFLIASLHGLDELSGTQELLATVRNSPDVRTEQFELNEIYTPYKMESNRALEVESNEVRSDQGGSQICMTDDDNNVNYQLEGSIDKVAQWYTTFLSHDLFLLENQIPFFVMKRIFKLLAVNNSDTSLAERIAGYVEIIFHSYPKAIEQCNRPKDFQHLLHLCHMYFRPSQSPQEVHSHESRDCCIIHRLFLEWKYSRLGCDTKHKDQLADQKSGYLHSNWKLCRWRRAVQYYDAGIEFIKKEYDSNKLHSLLDIRFDKGITEVPCLVIDRNTGSLFRNLIAFERTSPQFGNYFTAYIAFLSQLISTPDDVAFLAKKGIIIHEMRFDEEVSALFSKLGKNVDFDHYGSNYLKSVSQAMEEHYQSRLNRWMAWLWHNHFSNPWLILAVVAAAIVLLCTILQSLFALLAYLDPPGGETSPGVHSNQQ